MTRRVDVRKSVMDKVVSYEKRRTRQWLMQFFSGTVVLLAMLAIVLWITAKEIVERQLLDLLTLFFEDQEIVAEFWRDTLAVLWEELPQRWLAVVLVIFVVFVVLLSVTRKKRQVIENIRRQLATYDKTR